MVLSEMSESQERITSQYKNLSKRFNNPGSDYSKQYCSIYNIRLGKMRQILAECIQIKWGPDYPVCKLHELSTSSYTKCVIIGTLFKDQKLKPSVLKQLAEGNQLVPQPVHTHFTDASDVLYIEDELQRYQLNGGLNSSDIVTGITCALLGQDLGTGKFLVEDYCFAGYRSQIERPLKTEDSYIVLISGLDLMHIEKSLLSLQLFSNWVSGALGKINKYDPASIARVIIAGNSIRSETIKSKPTISMTSRTEESSEAIDAVKTLDTFLVQLCQVLDVDIMPGEHDPSNHILPQKNMHHCMFPNAAVYKSTNLVSNPYECDIDGVRIIGTSGQPVTDILRFSDIQEPIEVLENCLKWNHMAPTAPDTLGCFPFYDNDPFIFEDCPHVLFTANTDKFDTKLAKGDRGQVVRLICVPEFSRSFTACILNLKDLKCEPITFKTV
ncbi:PREDICTED: DNA polymerase delta small subunit [Nicrophorus vespilloides]|uniref:DNA polymerase delta small subunit n=1 Tax=Nicrophorus vespilloides TaxID=110193 RepID=A0ABM1M799_NICVS|nr:PREDICTED: DNA polymerase delta small subunit [Nicrophorus vespilloides]